MNVFCFLQTSFLMVGISGLLVLFCHGETPYKPKLSDGKSPDFHDFPMGVLSATGRLYDLEREIVVRDVGKSGFAEQGGLRSGDRIISIEGKISKQSFSMSTDTGLEGPQNLLGEALEAACASKNQILNMEVKRNEKKIFLEIKVPSSPAFASTYPKNVPRAGNTTRG